MIKVRRLATLGLLLAAGLAACQSPELAPPAPPAPPPGALGQPDKIVVSKSSHRMELIKANRTERTYQVALGVNPGPKIEAGDKRTPEGAYRIVARKPDSRFHRSLQISYPSDEDRRRAAREGKDPGGMIMIHGLPNGKGWIGNLHRSKDWTDGCIAVTDEEMDELWRLVSIGTPIEIKP